VQEGAAGGGAVHEAGGGARAVALLHLASELRLDTVPAHVVLEQLPWLLERASEAGLAVLTGRELPVHQVRAEAAGGAGAVAAAAVAGRACRAVAGWRWLAGWVDAGLAARLAAGAVWGAGRGGVVRDLTAWPALPCPPPPFLLQVLEILAGRSDDLRWQYLQHVVHKRGCADPLLHTELALLLSESIHAAVHAGGLSGEQVAAVAPWGAQAAPGQQQAQAAGRSAGQDGCSSSAALGVK
jgi:hypothetical protein